MQQEERPAGRIISELCRLVAGRYSPQDSGLKELGSTLPWLSFIRLDSPTLLNRGMLSPSMCMVLQGSKKMLIGERVSEYGPGSYSLAAVDMPVSGQVTEATAQKPYYGVRIDLDGKEIADLVVNMKVTLPDGSGEKTGAWVAEAEEELQAAFLRLVKLLDSPEHLYALAPLIKQEILYRLVVAPAGAAFWKQALGWAQGKGVGEAIAWIKQNYAEPLIIDELAKRVGMSTSGLHHRFKALTIMSPLQYQKQIRLLEARRRLLSSEGDVASVAWKVGYDSPSQFSREYRRAFGASPLQDIDALRQQGTSL
ncbi:AraC family transcriptional regulator [Cedecea davisae]|uniref:AraC family transcriptional regulator n=1 Tax=Cedecea davisae TaxID=158484 RepID=UPI001D0B9A18|nr:AraC family transcriptional regulator [Cedecea davisae]